METQEDRPDLGTAERNALRDRLLACGAVQLAEAYEGAVRLLAQPDFPARRNLLSHLVRDIANGLPEVVTGDKILRFDSTKALDELAAVWHAEGLEPAPFAVADEPPSPTVPVSSSLVTQVSSLVRDHERVALNRRDQFALLMDALRPGSQALRPALEPVIREWVDEVRWFVGLAHVPRKPTTTPDDAELERRFRHFEDGLRGILAGHFEVTKEIDAILDALPPGDETLQRLMPLLGGAEQLRYFFNRIDDRAWVGPLERQGFFKHAPDPITNESRGTTAHWRWPAAPYLIRMAAVPEAQEAVARIASEIETANITVHDDLGAIALALSPRLAARLVKPLVRALRSDAASSPLAVRVAALAEELAVAGEHAASKRLLKGVVDAALRNRVEPHDITLLFERHLPGAVSGLGFDALDALSRALTHAVRRSGRGDPMASIEDHSSVWRPAIARNGRGDARDVLVTAVRQAAEQLATVDPDATIACLRQHEWLVFQRIGMHVLMCLPTPPQQLVAEYLLDRRLFDHFDTCREYGMLLRHAFDRLAVEQQREWLRWVDAGRPHAEIREFLERWSGQVADEHSIQQRQREWRWRRLGLVHEFVPPPWDALAQGLLREFGAPTSPEQVESPWLGLTMGWQSPLSTDQARALNAVELARFCRSVSFDNALLRPEGLASVVAAVVKEAPQRYAADAMAFCELQPTLVRAVLGALASAVAEERQFPWPAVFALAEWVLHQEVTEPEQIVRHGEDPGWGSARGAVVRLLENALAQAPSPLPLEARTAVWNLLTQLRHDPNSQRREEALEASVGYAVWVRRSAQQPRQGDGTLDDVEEVRTALEAALDSAPEHARALYGAIGRQLPLLVSLDEAWVRCRLRQIFPAERADLRDAAWFGYLRSAFGLSERAFALLREEYAAAAERLRPTSADTNTAYSAEHTLAQHLVALHGAGMLEKYAALQIVERFIEHADAGHRRYLMWYVAHALTREEHASLDLIARFRQLWDIYARTASQEELDVFGSWFATGRFDDAWALQQLSTVSQRIGRVADSQHVVERLAKLSSQHAATSMRLFARIAGTARDAAGLRGVWITGCRVILAAALRSGDATAQKEAIETYHHLGSLGFRKDELLPLSDDLDDPASIAYFTWDHPMTIAEIHQRLAEGSEPERNRMLGQILREAKPQDVWRFTTPQQVSALWEQLDKHLGRRRELWRFLLDRWQQQGLLAAS